MSASQGRKFASDTGPAQGEAHISADSKETALPGTSVAAWSEVSVAAQNVQPCGGRVMFESQDAKQYEVAKPSLQHMEEEVYLLRRLICDLLWANQQLRFRIADVFPPIEDPTDNR
jgi:hypothetical protein